MNSTAKKYMVSHKIEPLDLAQKIKILSAFPLFQDVSEIELKEFAEKTRAVHIPPMEIFVEQDADERQAFFVYQGATSVFRSTKNGEIINIDLLGAPELVGVQGLIHSKASPASAMALNEIRALVLIQKDFEIILQKYPLIAIPFLKLLADRMRGFNLFLEHLLSNNLYDRTWKMLQNIAPYFPDNEISLSQEQFADLIWGTRSRVTEVLVRLEKEGKIITTRRKIKLL